MSGISVSLFPRGGKLLSAAESAKLAALAASNREAALRVIVCRVQGRNAPRALRPLPKSLPKSLDAAPRLSERQIAEFRAHVQRCIDGTLPELKPFRLPSWGGRTHG